jgi:hypothetical protein
MAETETEFGWYITTHGGRSVYPLSIVAARYGGVYEGGEYLAFPCDPDAIPEGWDSGDVACATWFSERLLSPIGRGRTPDDALSDLVQRLRRHGSRIAMPVPPPETRGESG